VNFVTSVLRTLRAPRMRIISDLLLILLLSIGLAGCGDRVQLPSQDQLLEFENAGPSGPVVDRDRLMRAKIDSGPYRVVPGDVLELTMPTILQIVTAEESSVSDKTTPYICRVGNEGNITLPVIGEIEVEGKSLADVESSIIDAYHPKYAVIRPSVFARVLEYKTAKVSITGAVQKPGIYALHNDQMSLVALLMEAGGIVDEGAALIRIARANRAEKREAQSPPPDTVDNAAGNQDRTEATLQAAEGMLASANSKPILIGPRSIDSDRIAVQLAFQRSNPGHTKGRLLIVYDKKLLRTNEIDMQNELHRQSVVRYLHKRDTRFSTVRLEPELLALAEELTTVNKLESELTAMTKELKFASQRRDKGTNSERPDKARGLNIPFADAVLANGDSVVVERLALPIFTVIGLVNKQGNVPYPPDAKYNLMQAIAFAGGLNEAADPRYATIYRLKADGGIARAPFQIIDTEKGTKLTEALAVLVKPGDIVAIEHTPRTRKNAFMERMFMFRIGAYFRINELWDDE